jgi:predicted DNA-binding transcriptional regulator YafY
MPINKSALTRYKLIDECLATVRYDKITVEYFQKYILEKSGINVSIRQLKNDLDEMRNNSEFLAPIHYDRKFGYQYSNADYRLTGIKLSNADYEKINEAVAMLKQFSGLKISDDVNKILARINAAKENDVDEILIFDQSNEYNGSQYLEFLFQIIKRKQCVDFIYSKFNQKADVPSKARTVSPLAIKEYLKRWYLVADDKGELKIFALDRIINLEVNLKATYHQPKGFSAKEYFKNAYGITVHNEKKPSRILLRVKPPCMEYMQNFPWHSTQKIEKVSKNEMTVSFQLHESHELVKEILGWGLSIEVLEPATLKERILKELKEALSNYS